MVYAVGSPAARDAEVPQLLRGQQGADDSNMVRGASTYNKPSAVMVGFPRASRRQPLLPQDGEQELVTGKRVYAHEVEPGDTDGSVVVYYRFDKSAATWKKYTIFHGDPALNAPRDAKDRWALKDFPRGSAGTGFQMAAVDIDNDGDLDLVCPGKSGLYLFENEGR